MIPLARLAPLALLTALLLSACVSPAWDDHDYALKAGKTAESAVSAVRFARSVVAHRDRMTGPYAEVVLTEAVRDLSSVNDQFGGVQPPSDSSDRVRDEVLRLTERAESEVADLLIQWRRDGVKDPEAAVRELDGLASELSDFAEKHR
ncbi:hypothetical protein DI270_024140 [Microbispora triticiradicis]|uniref:Uncharacterized protein n=1 Tax=Microbispora triticiradicis TaxID=2200763 RepID=A0ABX9LET1_9ACTN|nr:hypothetical protein [Microbispora triticiradicis]RGA02419.1 hypothetical protein DI270_024140 [Microbispora triticiradicis]GLW24424.1 hypothetical protein Mame01_44670 [Microbispora amethystogenes]